MLSLTFPATSEARSQLQQHKAPRSVRMAFQKAKWSSLRGWKLSQITTIGGEVTTRLRAWARKDSSFTRYFPSKASRNLRYVYRKIFLNPKSGPTQIRSPRLKLAAKNCPGPQLAAEFSPGGLIMAAKCGPLCQI